MSLSQTVKDQILEALKNDPNAGSNPKALSTVLGMDDRLSQEMLTIVVENMLEEGELEMLRNGSLRIPAERKLITGTVDFVNPNYAFVICGEDQPDVFVRAEDLMYALHGDKVKILMKPERKKRRSENQSREGEVVEIIERVTDTFVGKVEKVPNKEYVFVLPDSRKMYLDIFVHPEDINGAKPNDKVLVKIMEWPDFEKNPVGKIIEVLGQAGENDAEMHSIMAEFGLPVNFPKEVLAFAEAIPEAIPQAEIEKRWDMRDVLTFTIDPIDAKDFDDAISFRKLANGNYEVGVHIADVSHYVKPDTLLDEEAFNRATSVYLVDRTIPMLPEKLSNNLCSLRPNEDKLTFSTVFELKPDGDVVNEWYGRTVIHSDRRLAYEDAQEIIEGKKDPLTEPLLELNRLAKFYREKRFANGAIGFETVEVKFKLDEKGRPLGVIPKVRKDAHKLIEEFMLLANRKVAEFVHNKKKGKSPLTMIYRIHEQPDYEKLRTFAQFARRFGFNLKTDNRIAISRSLNAMLESIEGTEMQSLLSSLAIRTMAKARYSAEPLGHFGLAFDFYSHFTSPIRRYPDVLAHRLLQHYLDNGSSADASEVESKSRHCSNRERLATDAERASIKYKQVEYILMQEPDKVYEGVVSGLTEFGIYVEMVENLCEGMVRLNDLKDDYYELDKENYRLVGRGTRRIISFGEKVEVKVKEASLERRTIDLELILDYPGMPTQKPTRRVKRKKR